ncbi:hypothetical protein KGQ27_02270 [Patescibacteria group bacterium]|nr:hypothetical protein [Patescibacteria group bacterium]MDE1946393.1 hypothetical protein [Patescibacteria group bacterium]MDE2011273.1 hypothetical protein [Patescibacteria group bacterium]MDE2233025.1 hypothetical protein [Patescibacteria group bacterium]
MEPNVISNITPENTSVNFRLAGPSELIKSAWNLFKAHWRMLAAIAVIPSILTFVSQMLMATGAGVMVIVALILSILAVILSFVMQGALIDAVKQYSNNASAKLSVGDQYSFGFRYFWPFVLIIVIQALVFGGSFILFVFPGIIISVYAAVYAMTLFVDNKRGFNAFSESFSLIKGRWWKVFGRLIILALLVLACYVVIEGIVVSLISVLFGIGSFSSVVLTSLANIVMAVTVGPFATAYLYKMYESLKATRSGQVLTETFRIWLKVFLVFGAVAVLVLIIIGFVVITGQYSTQELRTYTPPTSRQL